MLKTWILKLESIPLGAQVLGHGHDFINLESTHFDNACIVISVNCDIAVLEKNLKKKPYIFL